MATPYDVHWSLFCETSGRQIDGLTFTQAKGVLLSIHAEHREFWLAWHELITEWKPVSDFSELQEESRDKERITPPLATKPIATGLKLDEPGGIDQRLNRRFHKQLEVTINIGTQTYHTHTENISLGGMLLSHSIPNSINEKFTATISNGIETIVAPCAMIPEPSGGKPRRIRFLNDHHASKLFSWLVK